jgi:putative ABC transport system permease protein
MKLLRNLARRKLRTTLTIAGITIGIWALVVFSSMANKINALVEGGSAYFGDKILVSDGSGSGFGGLPLRVTIGDELTAIEGVDVVVPSVSAFADELEGASFGAPDQVSGSVWGSDEGREQFELKLIGGRFLAPDDEGSLVAMLGADIARKRNAVVGGTIDIHDRAYQVVGILEPTLTAPDTTIYVPLTAGQEILHQDLPAIVRDELQPQDMVSEFVVYPAEGVDIPALAARIEADIDGVSTLTGAEFDETVGSSIAIFNAIIVGVGLISLVVGGLSVINTMAMSVAERTREIGIKRAIGGTRRRIIRELMAEAGMIGFIGGVIGLGLGALIVMLANDAGRSSGTILFELTTETAIFAVAFSTILGVLAGILPAWNAARLDPVAALRYE